MMNVKVFESFKYWNKNTKEYIPIKYQFSSIFDRLQQLFFSCFHVVFPHQVRFDWTILIIEVSHILYEKEAYHE